MKKTKYILENRRKWLNNEITQLFGKYTEFLENSSYYKEYNKQKGNDC
ncbi:MAG: hypothetical protein L6V88_00420 [Anaerotruncus sp.]|nr:MAG: hypothetical protein L6V88_00420 [Anaerotruncus sp.]